MHSDRVNSVDDIARDPMYELITRYLATSADIEAILSLLQSTVYREYSMHQSASTVSTVVKYILAVYGMVLALLVGKPGDAYTPINIHKHGNKIRN